MKPKEQSTEERIYQYEGLKALVAEWECQSVDVRAENHEYILYLRKRMRQVQNYIVHRKDPGADLVRQHKSRNHEHTNNRDSATHSNNV